MIATRYTQFRYHDDKTWSPWEDVLIQFSSELMKGLSDVLNEPNSPMFSPLEKDERGWVGGSEWPLEKTLVFGVTSFLTNAGLNTHDINNNTPQ